MKYTALVLLLTFVLSPCLVGQTVPDRGPDGDQSVQISGELKKWHKISLTLDGPFAHERDVDPNPFRDYELTGYFVHESGAEYRVPGYFAADGHAAETSAESGTKWRVHFAPDQAGLWRWQLVLLKGRGVAVDNGVDGREAARVKGEFVVAPTDKAGRDLRGEGRLQYVGSRYLRFAESGRYFLKTGADAPETFLAFQEFDETASYSKRGPLKNWAPHLKDWKEGDPVWQGEKGKGIIGAVNYLSEAGMNVFSFLTYNAGGDGDNVWPHISRRDKLHFDCSKLDQWGIVFDHATAKGMYLHFKLQETENDDDKGPGADQALDGGDTEVERKLYLRELIARFGHNLALNWNLGEENTMGTERLRAMARYIRKTDPYGHPVVVHTYPGQQDQVYGPLLGDPDVLHGMSLQNSNVANTHHQVVKWVRASAASGHSWVVAFDEPGDAGFGQPPDPDYPGVDEVEAQEAPTIHQVRKQVLWGALLGGGAGVEYYFGYRFPQNDLNCEDYRSRARSWAYCKIATDFFYDHGIPFWEMVPSNELVGNPKHTNQAYCLAKPGEVYVIFLPEGGSGQLDLSAVPSDRVFVLEWFNPREGGQLILGGQLKGGAERYLPAAPLGEDWVALLRAR